MERQADFTGILGETWAIVASSARAVLIYVLVTGGLSVIGILFGLESGRAGQLWFGLELTTGEGLAAALFHIFSTFVSFVAGYWLVTRYLLARGRFAGGNRFWPYLGMAVVAGLAIVLGIVALVVPGIILMVRWSAAVGFLVGDGASVGESLGASYRATEGHGWSIFFAGLAMMIGFVVISALVAGLFMAVGWLEAPAVASTIVNSLARAFTLAFGIGVYCLVHLGTRNLQEVFA